MPDAKESPAVKSMKKEQASQRRRSAKGELDQALEDTFPASDPVSVTHSAVSAGRTDATEAKRVRDNDDEYPVADEAPGPVSDADVGNGRVYALGRSPAKRSEKTSETSIEAANVVTSQARSVLRDVQDTIRNNPLTAMGIVAAIAFVCGVTR